MEGKCQRLGEVEDAASGAWKLHWRQTTFYVD